MCTSWKTLRSIGFLLVLCGLLPDTGEAATVGAKFPIASAPGTRQIGMSIAFDGTNYLVGIIGNASSPTSVTAQLVSASGSLVGPRISVGRTGGGPSVAFDGTRYLLVWLDDATQPVVNLYGQFLTTSGTLVGSPFLIVQGVHTSGVRGLIFDGTQYFLTYLYGTGMFSQQYGRFIQTDGTVSDDIVISQGMAFLPGLNNVAFDGTNYLVAWSEVTAQGMTLKGRLVSQTGELVGSEHTIVTSQNFINNASVTFGGTSFLVAWYEQLGEDVEELDLFAQRVDISGNPIGGLIPIAGGPKRQHQQFIAFDGSNFLVTWTDSRNDSNGNSLCDTGEGTCWDIYGRFISASGTPAGSEFHITTDATNEFMSPVIFANGKHFVIWTAGDEACEGLEGAVFGAFITPESGGTQSLTVSKDGTGSGTVISTVPSGAIDCGTTCDGTFPHGTSVTLSASAATGSIFAGWSGEGCSGTDDCTVSMTQSRAVTATFNLVSSSHILTVKVAGSSGGAVTGPGITCGTTCSTSVASNTTVTLTASASAGGTFREWRGACSGPSLTCQVTMNAAKEVTAVFTKTFSDSSLTGVPIKAAHFTELRAAINTLRSHYPGLPAFTWTDSTLAPGSTPVKRQHLLDLRTALDAAYTAAGKTHTPYPESISVGSTPIRASHLNELRTHVRGLE